MNIKVNDEPLELPNELSIEDLLTQLGYDQAFVAVALNRECVRRGTFASTAIQSGDEIEILSPMAGG